MMAERHGHGDDVGLLRGSQIVGGAHMHLLDAAFAHHLLQAIHRRLRLVDGPRSDDDFITGLRPAARQAGA